MKITLFLLLVLGPYWLLAQPDTPPLPTGTYWSAGIGIPISTVRDRAHSPLAYRGMGFRTFFTHERIRSNRVFRSQLTLTNVQLRPYSRPKLSSRQAAKLNEVLWTFGYFSQVSPNTNPESVQYVGGSFTLHANTRSYPLPSNNKTGFAVALSVNLAGMDRRQLDGNDWTSVSTAEIPLLSLLARPGYVGIPESVAEQKVTFKSIWKPFQVVSLNKFFRLSTQINVDHRRRDWRYDRFSYQWDVFAAGLPRYKPIVSSTSSLGYAYRILHK